MLELLWLVPAIPFAGALVLAVLGAQMSHKSVTTVGVGSVAASASISLLIAAAFLSVPPATGIYTQTLWTWIDVGSFRPQIAFYLDALTGDDAGGHVRELPDPPVFRRIHAN